MHHMFSIVGFSEALDIFRAIGRKGGRPVRVAPRQGLTIPQVPTDLLPPRVLKRMAWLVDVLPFVLPDGDAALHMVFCAQS